MTSLARPIAADIWRSARDLVHCSAFFSCSMGHFGSFSSLCWFALAGAGYICACASHNIIYVATPELLPHHLRISPSVIMAHPSHLLGSSFDLDILLRHLIYFSHRYSLACFFMLASYTCFFLLLNHPHISTFFDIFWLFFVMWVANGIWIFHAPTFRRVGSVPWQYLRTTYQRIPILAPVGT